jgi:hypothetical protein
VRSPRIIEVSFVEDFSKYETITRILRHWISQGRTFLKKPHIRCKNGIFDLIDHDLVFENASTNKIKMNHSITFVTGESGRETTELVTTLNTWEKDRRFVVSRVLKDEKDRAHNYGGYLQPLPILEQSLIYIILIQP